MVDSGVIVELVGEEGVVYTSEGVIVGVTQGSMSTQLLVRQSG